MKKIDESLFEEAAKDFQIHFEQENNSRIIFSGIYGVGKTTFLSTIFNTEYQNKLFKSEKYNVFQLYPVNYSIASNEDIYRYIKYDLIYKLIDKGIKFESKDFAYLAEFKKYLGKNIHRILAPLFLFLPSVGRDTFQLFNELDKLKDEFLKQCDDKKKDAGENFYDYLTELENTSGGIYERDIYTKLINGVLGRIKSNGEKQNVLIIDDLDRIDPAHLFRLLNVFAAHFDQNNDGFINKFDFDKIIFVCDINNIRNIFKHFYGARVDFNGYIDKFYSNEIYYFSNNYCLETWLAVSLGINTPNRSPHFNNHDLKFIQLVLRRCIESMQINFRNILKNDLQLVIEKHNRRYDKGGHEKIFHLRMTKIAILLSQLFGDTKCLIERMDEMVQLHNERSNKILGNDEVDLQNIYNAYLFPLLTIELHNYRTDMIYNYIKPADSMAYKYRIIRVGHFYEVQPEEIYLSRFERFWIDLKRVVEILHEKGIV